MPCPYCISNIPDDALVCPVCRRDLYVVRQLQARVVELQAQLAAASDASAGASAALPEVEAPAPLESIPEPPVRKPGSLQQALLFWLAPLLLLVTVHWLMIFIYDAKVLYLRLFALIVPLPFGFLFAQAARIGFVWGLLPAFLMAVAAVLAMSGVTAWIDQVPLLPQNTIEFREFIEFAASIGFSFVTGLWLQAWLLRRAEAAQAAEQRRRFPELGQKMTESLTRLNDAGSAVVAFVTTAFSIYTGLKVIFGN